VEIDWTQLGIILATVLGGVNSFRTRKGRTEKIAKDLLASEALGVKAALDAHAVDVAKELDERAAKHAAALDAHAVDVAKELDDHAALLTAKSMRVPKP
jgi:hypothetical protein